jgi:hypothetical protein
MAESKSAALPLGYAPMPLLSQSAAAGGGWTILRGGTGRNRCWRDKRRSDNSTAASRRQSEDYEYVRRV